MRAGRAELAPPSATEAPRLGLRDRKKLAAHATLARVARDLFATRGFAHVTVEDIAAAADVSRRTFFRYFPSKEDAFFERRAAQLAALEALLAAPLAGEAPFATVSRALLALAEQHVAERDAVLAEHRVLADSPELLAKDLEWDRRALGLLAAALARRGGDPRRARLAAGAIIGVLRVVIESWVEGRGEGDLRALGEEALALLGGLSPEPSPARSSPRR